MTLSSQLKLLANGINPETGEVLDESSLTNKPEVIRILFALAEEVSGLDKPRSKKPKMTPDERRQKNLAEGRPAKSHFPWEEEEKTRLGHEFACNADIQHLSGIFERSALAIAVQLQKQNLISEEELESCRQQ
jgi:hypothetical protein